MDTKAGHKTEERAHVLIKKMSNSNKISKARKGSLLCLSSMMVMLMGGTSYSWAQDNPVYANPSRAQIEIRMQEMENQIRQLTGKVENQIYEINSLNNKVRRLQGDVLAVTELGVLASGAAQPMARINPAASSAVTPPQPTVQANSLGIDLSAADPKPMKSITVGTNNGDPTAQYEAAYASLKAGDFQMAETGFKTFLSQHSDNVLAANAKYWLGETHYVRGNFKTAAREFAEGFQAFPNSAKSPDILLKLGMSLSGMGKNDQACVALGQVPVKFPVGHDDIIEQANTQRAKLACAG